MDDSAPTEPRPPSSRAGSSGAGWKPPSVEHLQSLLPQYEIISMLGHGGMGAVYKGKQKSLDRMVAIKILPPGLDDEDAKFVERFKNEARTMAKMNHPGIVSVYDFGEIHEGGALAPASAARTPRPSDATSNPTDSSPSPAAAGGAAALPSGPPLLYFIMEYVDGTDVAKMIQASGKLPADHALAITAHVCDALAYAHSNGVIHRDIKPANILINMQGQVKVADFGLAKMDDPSQTSGLTKTGMAMGTPDYVAPEALIMGVNVDGRADLYAIGVMLYQMLTGMIPRGMFMMPSIVSKREVDPRFDAIIARAMQTDREMRYQSATEIRKDLDVILTTPRVKPEASKAAAAVPQGAVKNVPGQRSAAQPPPDRRPGVALPARPAQESANAPGKGVANAPPAGRAKATPGLRPAPAAKPKPQSAAPNPKPKTGLIIGIAATLVIGGGLVFTLGGKKNSAETAAAGSSASTSSDTKSAAASSAPIKVSDSKPGADRAAAPPATTSGPAGTTSTSAALAGASALPGASSPAAESWQDMLRDPTLLRIPRAADGSERVQRAKEGLRFVTSVTATIPDSMVKADGAIRMRSVLGKPGTLRPNLRARHGSTGHYQAGMRDESTVEIIRYTRDAGKATRLRDFPIAKPLADNEPYLLELRAVGTSLTAKLNGIELGSVTDAQLASGSYEIAVSPQQGEPVMVTSFEFLDLSASGGAPLAAPAAATKDAPFVNSLGMKFVPVPITGGPTDGKRVLFSVWETRVQDYEAFVTETKRSWRKAGFEQDPAHPAVQVTWESAKEFCAWLTERERKAGKLAPDEAYRLPSDHEWSCAAGIGASEDASPGPGANSARGDKQVGGFPWGDQWPPPAGFANYSGEEIQSVPPIPDQKLIASFRDPFPYTSPVGSFAPSANGLFDLSGNVSELCEDVADFKAIPGKADPERIVRGASWFDSDKDLIRWSRRHWAPPKLPGKEAGFRVVLATAASTSATNTGGAWQEVLPNLDITRAIVQGQWRMEAGQLVGGGDEKVHGTCALPVPATGNLDLLAEVTTSSEGFVALFFTPGNKTGAFTLNGGPKRPKSTFRHTAGMEKLDGWLLHDTPDAAERDNWLPKGEKHQIVLQIRSEGLTAQLDGQIIYRWSGDWQRINMPDGWGDWSKRPAGPLFGIGAQAKTQITVHRIAWRPAQATAAQDAISTATPGTASAPPPRPATPDPKLATLLAQYTSAVTKAAASASAKDKPAFDTELARLKANAPLPAASDDVKLPEALKNLRGILREQLK
ncbi:MAG: protein kinase [Verrucomicrobiaceae bacterium]|nr:protein kinase [Verrucomicrobiaceae bacterium]